MQNLEEKSTAKCNQRKMTVLNSWGGGGFDTAWGNQSDTKAKPFQIYPSASKSIIRQHGESLLPKTHCSVELLGCFISEHHFHMLISKKKTTHKTKLRSPNCGFLSFKQPKREKQSIGWSSVALQCERARLDSQPCGSVCAQHFGRAINRLRSKNRQQETAMKQKD